MYLCYIDESGTPEVPGNTSHYVLAGLSIPIEHWTSCDKEIATLKGRFKLQNAEIHTAWLVRDYHDQDVIKDFDKLDSARRVAEVQEFRRKELLRLQRINKPDLYRQTKKNYEKLFRTFILQERKDSHLSKKLQIELEDGDLLGCLQSA